jgi:hypothetical protein
VALGEREAVSGKDNVHDANEGTTHNKPTNQPTNKTTIILMRRTSSSRRQETVRCW